MRLEEVIKGAVGPWKNYCDGFGSPSAPGLGYICAITMKTGKVPAALRHSGSKTLDEINAYDIAEANGAYIGQINMIFASSFCGPMGAIWGYHLARSRNLRTDRFFEIKRHDGVEISVYSVDSLIQAAEALLGTRERRRFPLIPGSHVPCAAKPFYEEGPRHIYCAMGIAITEDRERENAATLFVEDVGTLDVPKETIHRLLADSMIEVGRNQCVKYKELFVGLRDLKLSEKEFGCAMAAVPYLKLAKQAIPDKPESLVTFELQDWEKAVEEHFLWKTVESECSQHRLPQEM